MSDKVVQTTGEISKKVAEICTETVEDVEQTTGEISKKVAELYTETVENVEQTTGELTKKVTELYNETAGMDFMTINMTEKYYDGSESSFR